jgi:hypothetical protein
MAYHMSITLTDAEYEALAQEMVIEERSIA